MGITSILSLFNGQIPPETFFQRFLKCNILAGSNLQTRTGVFVEL